MRVIQKPDLIVLAPETDAERAALSAWKVAAVNRVFCVLDQTGDGAVLSELGRREIACREPINVTSRHPDPEIRLIGNFAETPFELDGAMYRTVEGFWQGLKFASAVRRREFAEMSGREAKAAGKDQPYKAVVRYEKRDVVVGTWEHWQLMRRACAAKFRQHAAARAALVSTLPRPLVHTMRRDSRTIPGAIMAEIWMSLRAELLNAAAGSRRRPRRNGNAATPSSQD